MPLSIQQIIANAAAANGIPLPLAMAQAQKESNLNPNAYNPSSGASGLFQLEPGTARDLGVTNPLDPQQNAQGGMRYLGQLYRQFGSWDLALAAFDWGMGNLQRAISTYGGAWYDHAPAETQDYVDTILGNAGMDVQATITPDSVINGAAQVIAAGAGPVADAIDAAVPPPQGRALVLTGIGLAVYLFARDFL